MSTVPSGSGAGAPAPVGSETRRRRSHRRLARLGLALGAVLVLAVVTVRASHAYGGSGFPGFASVASRSPTADDPPVSRLPALGDARAIEATNEALNDVGDPFVVPVPAGVDGSKNASYVLYWTTDWLANVPTAVSTDLVHWRRLADSLPILPAWARVVAPPSSWSAPRGVSTMTWGPSVQPVPGGWALYYSTEEAASGRQCIGAAFSTSATGPFVDTSTAPMVCQRALGGDIDPSIVTTATGEHALVWKNDGNANGQPVSIWEETMASDGHSTVGAAVRLIGADQAWEHGIIEGPSMLADTKGGWWLFFSGGTWQSGTYDTGVAWCATVSGPCREPSQRPLLASTPTAVSPGGLDTFVDHHGRLWASFSAFPSQPADAQAAMASPRVLEIAPVLSH